MTNEELYAYSRGQSDAYNAVFQAFTKAFEDGGDIYELRRRISAQWKAAVQRRSAAMHERT